MGTTVKQVNNLKIKIGIDGLYRVYHAKKEKGTCIDEFASLSQAILFCRNFIHT
jgi:hypothetical protein